MLRNEPAPPEDESDPSEDEPAPTGDVMTIYSADGSVSKDIYLFVIASFLRVIAIFRYMSKISPSVRPPRKI